MTPEKRNPVLFTALQKYCSQALDHLQNRVRSAHDLPRTIVQRPRITKPNEISQVAEVQLDLVGLLLQEEQNLRHLGGYAAVEQAMRKDDKVARHLDTLVGTSESALRVDVDHCLRRLLGQLLREQTDLRFREETFERIYGTMEDYFYRDTTELRLLAPLNQFQMEVDRIELARRLSVMRIPTHEREEILESSRGFLGPIVGASGVPVGWEEFTLELFIEASKRFGDQEASSVSPPSQMADEEFAEVLSALRLFKEGSVGYSAIRITPVGWDPFGGTNWTWGRGRGRESHLGPRYSLSTEEISSFNGFWTDYRRVVGAKKRTPRFSLALRRFNFGYERVRPEDRLIDYTIALEALLLKQNEQQELAYRFALRGARLLGDDETRRVEVHGLLRKTYQLRSEIAHGGQVQDRVRFDSNELQFNEFVGKVSEIVRAALKRFLIRIETMSEEQVITELDDQIVRGG